MLDCRKDTFLQGIATIFWLEISRFRQCKVRCSSRHGPYVQRMPVGVDDSLHFYCVVEGQCNVNFIATHNATAVFVSEDSVARQSLR